MAAPALFGSWQEEGGERAWVYREDEAREFLTRLKTGTISFTLAHTLHLNVSLI